MALSAGTHLGPYVIDAPIGEGGMGQVYRATDTSLGRQVAIKVLPEAVAQDSERLARFEREARALARLNHPGIATIHGIETSGGIFALVMELVEGVTLAERIAQGPIPFDEALPIARQIAEALEATHEHGIIHRDLKPANIKVRPDGIVKLLDFGLSKVLEPPDPLSDASQSPTSTGLATGIGVLLGTVAYMSPEQARGRPAGKPVDIWAFGCVLYEALSGRRAFAGDTIPDTLAAILGSEPPWHLLPERMPIAIRRLLRRCLAKDLRRRLHDIGDARLELDDAGDEGTVAETSPAQSNAVTGRRVEFQRLTDFSGMKESPVVSPDGKIVAFVALIAGRRQILIRLLAGGAPLQVTRDDTDHQYPRWAPDSSTLIYWTPSRRAGEGTIWEISALGGAPRRVAAAMGGADISHDGQRIALFRSSGEFVQLMVVTRNGSRQDQVTSLPQGNLYTSPRWSPDDRSIAFERMNLANRFEVGLHIAEVDGGVSREVARSEWLRGFGWLPDGTGLVYSSSRGSTILYPPVFNIWIVGCDGRGDRQITFGDVSYVEPDVHHSGKLFVNRIRSQSDVWRFPVGGSAAENTRDAVRITRQTGQAQTPSISPDGSEVVYLSDSGGHGNLWIVRTDGSSIRQVTFERDPDLVLGIPRWAPCGDWIVFYAARRGASSLWAIRPDGSELHELVAGAGGFACWSGDGRWVYHASEQDDITCVAKVPIEGGAASVFVHANASMAAVTADDTTLYYVRRRGPERGDSGEDLELCRTAMSGGSSTVLARLSSERIPLGRQLFQPSLSPDGRWLAAPLLDAATSNIWVLPASGGSMRALTDFHDRPIMIARGVSWSADSQFIYAAVAELECDVVLWDGLLS